MIIFAIRQAVNCETKPIFKSRKRKIESGEIWKEVILLRSGDNFNSLNIMYYKIDTVLVSDE